MARAVYTEWRVTAPLAGVAACCWAVDDPDPRGHLVLPDGAADLVFADGRLRVAGPLHRGRRVAAGPRAVGVRLLPGAAGALGVPGDALAGLEIDAREVLPGARALEEALAAAADAAGAARMLAAALADRVGDPRDQAAHVARAARLLRGDAVAAVARAEHLSERHLRRTVLRAAGVTPSALRRAGRLDRFLTAAAAEPGAGVAALAARAGYADESHCARDVRELAGLSPAGLLRARGLRAT